MHCQFRPILFCLLVGLLPTSLASTDELLPAEQAFAFSAELQPGQIQIRWDIAAGYYMYRDQVDVDLQGAVQSGDLVLPDAVIKREVGLDGQPVQRAIFTETLSYRVPLEFTPEQTITLVAKGQGCNEPIGVCYPPMVHRVSFTPPQLAAATAADTPVLAAPAATLVAPQPLDATGKLRALLSGQLPQQDFLEVDAAFKLAVEAVDNDTLLATFQVADGYYLYRDKTHFRSEGEARIGEVQLPRGQPKQDQYFGQMQVYPQDFQVPIKLLQTQPAATRVQLHARYQGCAAAGICYAAVDKSFTLQLPQLLETAEASALFQPSAATSTTWLLLGALLAGVGLAFTPCVLPLLPILSSVLAGQAKRKQLSKTRGGVLAASYVAGTAVTYTVIGAVAGASGEQLQAYFQNVWGLGILATVLVLMALSLFGLFRLQMPTFIQAAIQSKTGRLRATLPLVFLLGMLSALIIGACVSPVLIAFLGIAISQGDAQLGGLIMLLIALGMGIPLILFGCGAGHFLPRAGAWSTRVNHVLGVMLLGVAIYLLQALPWLPTLLLWGGFFVVLSVYLGATTPLKARATGWQHLRKGLAILLLVWGIVAFIGGFFGQRDIFRPLPANLFTGAALVNTPQHADWLTAVETLPELEAQLAQARQARKYVLLDYYADWCVDCVRMQNTTFQDARVVAKIQRDFIALQVDVTDPNAASSKALKRRFDVFGPPAMLLFDRAGKRLPQHDFYGYRDADALLALLNSL